MPAQKLKEFLNRNHVKYVSITHSPAITAQEVAASAHIPGWAMAKTVMVKIEGKMAMAVLPANLKVIVPDLREIIGTHDVKLASEQEFKLLFPDCEVGAMPPFGNLYGLDVYVAPALADNEEIAFNAGSHTEVIKMSFEDFLHLSGAKLLEFTT